MSQTPQWHFLDGTTIPVGTMYCIGRNYADHAAEMNASVPEDPIVFLKPPTAYVPHNGVVTLPSWSTNIHHEVEAVVVIGADADSVSVESAWDYVAGIGVGLDLTARDVQEQAKRSGHPWAVAKSWRGSAPVSSIVPRTQSGTGPWLLTCLVNGVERQRASTAQMERSVPNLIQYVASVFGIRRGDAIFTGTPAGVARVAPGDGVECTIGQLTHLTVRFA